jgi:cytochrome o ubiquinol oxidase subunit 1
MYHGKINFKTPMYWFLGFISTFTFGGMTGVILATPAADFQLHNSLFLVAHFHTMIIGGALFGIFAGVTYWFPKVTGIILDEKLGKIAFWLWLIGFYVSFIPLYILGFMGASRRLDHYDTSTGWQPFFIIALIGGVIIICGVMVQVLQIIISIKNRKQNLDTTGDPWNGRTLEWATSSPPPFYNFAKIPIVKSRDAFWEMKSSLKNSNSKNEKIEYEDIELPNTTGMGIYVSAFIFIFAFGAIWQSLFLIIVGFIGAVSCVLIRTFDEHSEHILPAAEVAKLEAGGSS